MKRDATMRWLGGVHVVQVGRSAALQVAGAALGQLGAAVKQVATLRDVDTNADVVLVDRIERPAVLPDGHVPTADEYLEFVAANNNAVWVTASAFGLTNVRSNMFASDLTLLAAGGILGHSRIGDEFAPTVPPGTVALKLVGHLTVAAALHGIHARRAGKGPVHADLSAQAAIIATGLSLEMAHALSRCPDEGGSARYGAPSGFVDCRDGAVYVLVMEEHQWRAFRSVMGSSLESVTTLEDARKQPDHVNSQLATWASTRTAQECEEVLQGAGVPCTAVNAVDTFAERSRALGRNFDLSGPDCTVLPAQIAEVPKENGANSGGRRLSDLRVLDAGHVLAVPLAGAWLGAMGAQVAKLEDLDRLDVYRRRGPFVDGTPGPNRSAYFNQLNFCKRPLQFSGGDSPRAVDLASFDVVMENLSPHRARAIGVDDTSVLAQPSPKLLLSSSGFGRTGAWAGYRAYGHNIHAFAGLVNATKDARGGMGDIGTPWADPLTSVILVTWTLAWCLADSHTSSLALDISMAELVAVQIAELAGPDAVDPYAVRESETEFFMREHAGGRLLAITLRSDQERARFETTTGVRVPLIDRRVPLIDQESTDPDGRDLEQALLEQGLAVSVVHTSAGLVRDEFVRDAELFRSVESPSVGRYKVTGLPWTFVGDEVPPLRPAPELPMRG
ncbi:CoA transferase [Rhodococcus sp. WAY2]|uniref:CoA transferase n=1 Tax=Rhodococcus sp. WAY2 TaxID=2663121 RepID=UPI00131FE5D1|nr:CoA transferase [Rhodococcus sp. WAY2]QHE73424.1 CAIB/BAIF family protein [Rhodococcus sp. WAY2]